MASDSKFRVRRIDLPESVGHLEYVTRSNGKGVKPDMSSTAAWLEQLFISQAHRRKGLGKKLMCQLASELKDSGYDEIHLQAAAIKEEEDEYVQAFYKSLGFDYRPPYEYQIMWAPVSTVLKHCNLSSDD